MLTKATHAHRIEGGELQKVISKGETPLLQYTLIRKVAILTSRSGLA